tara:strand:- start:40 stop:267 length:228 start_codon:yes stop_codon:yes gene_type:complete
MMCRIKKNLLSSLLKERGHSFNSFAKEVGVDAKTLRKFNDGLSINKVKAEKILNTLKQMPKNQDDLTDKFMEIMK